MEAALELWIVRHAHPLVAPGTCYGRSDVPADAAHTLQAAQTLTRALQADGCPSVYLCTSPLQRAMALAQSLTELWPQPLTIHTDPRLAEMDFGAWEGRLWQDLGETDFAAWDQDFAHHAVGGGESVAQFMARVGGAWHDLRECCLQAGYKRMVWVTHAGVARAMTLLQQGKTCPGQASDWPPHAPEPGQWAVMRW
jgi:alpha-ribazole phosphatase